MGRGDVTAHGFRSSFRDWAAERTNFAAEVAEMALAHAVSDKTVAAYNRTDLFHKRRRLMHAWGEFLAKTQQGGAQFSRFPANDRLNRRG
jgi:integrase